MPLQRYYNDHYKHLPASFYSPKGGLWSETSKLHVLDTPSLQSALEACDTPRLYVLPNKDNGYPKYAEYTSIPGCEVKKALYKKGKRPLVPTLIYKGKKVTCYPISTWFDVTYDTPMKDIIHGYGYLQKILEENFQPHSVTSGKQPKIPVEMLATPTQLGSELLMRSLPYGKTYSPLPDEISSVLIDNRTQGRIETFYHGKTDLDNLHYYDGRWMYAACTRYAPTGPLTHDNIPEFALTPETVKKDGTIAKRGVIPGFYRAEVTIPDSWSHIGLLPCITNGKPSYPRQPGRIFETFASSSEVKLALDNGWKVGIQERFLWFDTYKEPEMLKLWSDRLIKIRMEISETYQEPFRSMIRSASRNMYLHVIGSFCRSTELHDYYTEDEEDIPEEAESVLQLDNGVYLYKLPKAFTGLQKLMCQPHVALYVWGMARKKLVEHALQVPFESLVALRVDGIWTNCSMEYVDTGRPGQFTRKKLLQNSGLSWPKNNAEMIKLVQAVRA